MAKYIVEGLWDCPYCGTKGIKGSVKVCPTCGRPVGEDVKYYVKDTSRSNEVIPQSKDDVMPEWKCNYCGSYNKYTRTKCYRCGAAKETGTQDYFGEEEKRELDWEGKVVESEDKACETSPHSEESLPRHYDSFESDSYSKYQEKYPNHKLYKMGKGPSPRNWKNILFLGCGILFALLFIATLVWVFVPHESTVNIVDKSWTRTVNIEHYITVNEDDWVLPAGGRLHYTREEIHHYDSVLDHYETITEQKSRTVITGYRTETSTRDLGNGNFEVETHEVPEYGTEYYTETRQEPVYIQVPIYKTKYYYEIERWKHARSVDTKGNIDEPYWGEVILASNERESSRVAKYFLHYEWKENSKKIAVNEDNWRKVSVGDTVGAMVNKVGVTKILLDNEEINVEVEKDIE